jgi:hypothetical protein
MCVCVCYPFYICLTHTQYTHTHEPPSTAADGNRVISVPIDYTIDEHGPAKSQRSWSKEDVVSLLSPSKSPTGSSVNPFSHTKAKPRPAKLVENSRRAAKASPDAGKQISPVSQHFPAHTQKKPNTSARSRNSRAPLTPSRTPRGALESPTYHSNSGRRRIGYEVWCILVCLCRDLSLCVSVCIHDCVLPPHVWQR